MTERLPSYAELPVRPDAPAGSSWGVWGDHDVFGTLNLLTAERARRAARSVRRGQWFALNLDLATPEPPMFGRTAFRHEVTGEAGAVHDDVLHGWNTQQSSQWDGFRHFPHRTHGYYGGVPDVEHGIHHWAERGIVARAVLADVARWRDRVGRPLHQGTGDPITADDLVGCLEDQGTPVEIGDVLLVRTGWLAWYRALDADARAEVASHPAGAPQPGLAGTDVPRLLWDLHIAALAADNGAVEVLPSIPGMGFLHPAAIALLGIPLGEMWDLDALADDCAATGTYDSLLTSAPLNLRHGVASPPNAIALR
jgi:hypothetical protein